MNIKATLLIAAILLSSQSTIRAQTSDELSEPEILKVTCPNKRDIRNLRYYPEKKLWCDTTLTSFCKPKKREAGYEACGRNYASKLRKLAKVSVPKLSTPEPVSASNTSNSTSVERIRLQQEQIDIEQQRLDIKTKQVELDKEVLRLKSLL